jgi:hypothetical protein
MACRIRDSSTTGAFAISEHASFPPCYERLLRDAVQNTPSDRATPHHLGNMPLLNAGARPGATLSSRKPLGAIRSLELVATKRPFDHRVRPERLALKNLTFDGSGP